MLRAFGWSVLVLWLVASPALADVLWGQIRYNNKMGKAVPPGGATITTSYDHRKATINKKGTYRLDFGKKVGKKVTVYVNGKKYKTIEVKGKTRLDIYVPKKMMMPAK